MALKVDVGLNARAAQSGAKDLSRALDDVGDALDDIARDGDKAADKVEASFRDMVRDAKKAGDDTGDAMRQGFRKASEGAEEFKDEANSTAREAAASFDGSAESIGDTMQEIAANAFAGFGPAGAVAGLAAAAGIGLAKAGFDAVSEAQALSEENIAGWAQAFVEAGSQALTAGVMAARFQDIITDGEKFKTAEKNAKDWGVSTETAIAAMSGDAGAISDVKESVRLLGEALADTKGSQAAYDAAGNLNGQLFAQDKAYNTAKDSLAKLTGEMDAGQQRAAILNGYYRDLIGSAASATKEVDELGNAVYTLPDGTQIMIDASTGQATQNLSAFKGDLDEVAETVVKPKVELWLDDSAVRNYRPPIVRIPGKVEIYRTAGGQLLQ